MAATRSTMTPTDSGSNGSSGAPPPSAQRERGRVVRDVAPRPGRWLAPRFAQLNRFCPM
jgi:hypothetical protein